MLGHMRDREVAIFPPICQGLCEKAASCTRQLGHPPGPGETDCETACAPGGAYAEVPDAEFLCVHESCGPPFLSCRVSGGPAAHPPTADDSP
jgi:hypothetical protein